jgi:cytochrome c oxidase subunit 2
MLETLWIGAPVILAFIIFALGARLFLRIYALPSEGMDIYVVGKQWMWKFEHPSGQREINELHVPVNQVVRLTLIAQDVIHSFYVPAFRLKRDVVPGGYTTLWFEATETGRFHLFCAEYCGTRHSGMIGQIVVMEPRQYEDWLTQRPLDLANPIPEQGGAQAGGPMSMADAGAVLFQNLGCANCHQMDGRGVGPVLVGLVGSPVQLADGETVTADADYIRRSIIDPNAQVVAGYPPVMPTFAGQIDEEELLRLVEYIRSLGDEQTPAPEPASDGG